MHKRYIVGDFNRDIHAARHLVGLLGNKLNDCMRYNPDDRALIILTAIVLRGAAAELALYVTCLRDEGGEVVVAAERDVKETMPLLKRALDFVGDDYYIDRDWIRQGIDRMGW